MNDFENTIRFITEGDPEKWESTCLPIGNGYMGATFFGGIERERVVLNEKTLWIGGPSPHRPHYNGGNRKDAYKSVKKVQELLAAGKYDDVLKLLPDLTCETGDGFGAYQMLCNAVFEFPGIDKSKVTDYERCLDIDNSLYSCTFTHDSVKYTREAFASYPARAIVMRFSGDKRESVSFTLSLDRTQEGCNITAHRDTLTYSGSLTDNKMYYCASFVIRKEGGSITAENGRITVTDADSVVIYFTAATDYSDEYPTYRSGIAPVDVVDEILTRRCTFRSFDVLYNEHLNDYRALYGRVSLKLGTVTEPIEDTETLLSEYKKGSESAAAQLEPLYFRYGRYLLISSSREGSLPANLQGVWNESNTPPWCCDYHINVNLQMNYWGAFNTNLAETAKPLVRFLDSLRAPGRITAKEYYGIASDSEHPENGWIAHTQSTPFGWTSPGWDFYWGWSTAAVAWLMLNIYDYYDFTRDEEYLREEIYPIMREAARFYSQWLIWDEKQGRLVSSPTYSPEHGPVTIGNTYEQSLIRECLLCYSCAADALGDDKSELYKKVAEQLPLLKPFSVSKTGLLKEWFEEDEPDFDRSKIQQNHRHISHLLCLYPGHLINNEEPELMKAAIATMNDRGDESTGWARAYKVNLWARTGDGERAYKLLRGLLTDCTYPNLWDFHPPFQIDGNFGGSAGIAEMLLQCTNANWYDTYIEVIPAIPKRWASGEFEGLCARGGFEVSAKWNDHKVTEIRIKSLCGKDAFVRTDLKNVTCDGEKVDCPIPGDHILIPTEKGKTYIIS